MYAGADARRRSASPGPGCRCRALRARRARRRCSRRIAAAARIASARSCGSASRQAGNAACAACTARSTSSASASATHGRATRRSPGDVIARSGPRLRCVPRAAVIEIAVRRQHALAGQVGGLVASWRLRPCQRVRAQQRRRHRARVFRRDVHVDHDHLARAHGAIASRECRRGIVAPSATGPMPGAPWPRASSARSSCGIVDAHARSSLFSTGRPRIARDALLVHLVVEERAGCWRR